jgi:predicted flap endonuclease-1-like 5' DNA nuclease
MHPLPFETPTQLAALVLTLLAGWLLGLASASGGRKWRERYEEEEIEAASYRHQAEIDLKEANRRIRDLEAETARLKRDADVAATAATAAPVAAVAATTSDEAGGGWRGWFGWGRDNLSRIKGIDEAREKRLNELGIKTYRELEKMTADDEAALEQRLELEKGTIAGEAWREQAALLRAGNEDEHAKKFG